VSGAVLAQGSSALEAPTLKRRLAAFVYEGVLLFGVLMIAGIAFSASTGLRDPAAQGTLGLQSFLFLVLGLYFGWFWSHGGQTVAMKAWHIRLTDAKGGPVSMRRALVRYVLCWLWFAPALLTAHLSGLKGGGSLFGVVATGVLAYAALSRLSPERQFWHDVVCGTRLVDVRPAKPLAA
jgi:uncharacterized RDD family membrane protein YckC